MFFSLGEAPSIGEEFKPVKLRLKIDLVSYPARAEGLGKYEKLILKTLLTYWIGSQLIP